ncbi:MAG: nucleotidyltransferase domain-containing protein [Nanoarchaeota archaeon]|nr:nucleotidyltransferase domain-containing protein [Nanoarchaeota archaeon]MBU1005813.1 nucleotidyltransferase domain-containing protein [Nanoarchaeota archaeon]MBU1946468.1 nucleotidyltransferase domain-containing protein [Nanoarchaeota archaeon]
MNSRLTQLKKISRDFFKANKDSVIDIVLFGSLARGKENPNDIDVLVLFKDKVNKDVEYKLRKNLGDDVSIISKTETGLIDVSFDAREGFLFEGYSLVDGKSVASRYGFSSFGLIIYDTKRMTNTQKTRFYYALNGRGGSSGVVESLSGIKLSDNILAVPLCKIENAKEFFDFWKLDYKYIPSLIPSTLAKKQIIGKVR